MHFCNAYKCPKKWMGNLSRSTWCLLCCVNECTTYRSEKGNSHLTQMSEGSRFQPPLPDWATGLSFITSLIWNSPTVAAAAVEVSRVDLPPALQGSGLIRAIQQGGKFICSSRAAVSGAVLCRRGRAITEPECAWALILRFYMRMNHLTHEVITHLQIQSGQLHIMDLSLLKVQSWIGGVLPFEYTCAYMWEFICRLLAFCSALKYD